MIASAAPLRELRGPRRSRGLAAVEFVVTAPFVLLLLFAGAETGRAFVQYATLSYSIRDSARFVSEHSMNGTTQVVAITGATVTQARNLAVYGNIAGTGNAKLPNYQTGQVAVIDAGDDNIRVTATYPYQAMLGSTLRTFGFGSGSIPLTFNMHIAVTMRAIS
jgi:Flp pilus assembly protein TadG